MLGHYFIYFYFYFVFILFMFIFSELCKKAKCFCGTELFLELLIGEIIADERYWTNWSGSVMNEAVG